MDMDPTATKVVFRVWKGHLGTVFALFPDDAFGPGLCDAYEHVGQHCGARYAICISLSRPATPEEYAELKQELESSPYEYKLDVCKRRPAWTRQRH